MVIKVAAVAVSFVNLLVVWYVFDSTRKTNRKLLFNQRRLLWYRELVVEPYRREIDKCYDSCTRLLDNSQKTVLHHLSAGQVVQASESARRSMGNFSRLVFDLRRHMVDVISAMDINFAEDLHVHFERLQDDVTQPFGTLLPPVQKSSIDFGDILRQDRVQLFRKLYEFEMSLLGEPPTGLRAKKKR